MTLGVNVGWVGSYRPEDIAASGAKAVRCTYQPSVPLVHGRAWMGALQTLGVDVLMLLDNDAHWWGQDDPWRAGVGRAADEYEDLWTWVQVLNEPDAGWTPDGHATLEERASAHPSSWVLNPLGVSARLITAREMLGPNAYVVGPGLCSGHPQWADQVDWSPVNELAVHPYAKDAYSPELRALLESYRKHGKPIRATEYDSRTPEMHQCLADWGYNAFAFTWQDGGDIPNGIGMHDHQGNPKPSYHDFVAAAGAPPIVQPPVEEPTMPDNFLVGDGLRELMAEWGTTPATKENYLKDEHGRDTYSFAFGQDDQEYRWLPWKGKAVRVRTE